MDLLNQVASIVLPIILVLISILFAFELVALFGWGVKRWRRSSRPSRKSSS